MNAAKVTLTATVLAAALGLALVFSVSSAEAQKLCEPCQRCDNDGDGLIQDRPFCTKKCDGLVDDDDSVGDPELCPVDGDVFINLYTVELTGPVTGEEANWNGSSGGDTIQLPVFNLLNVALDLSFFAAMGEGDVCFPGAGNTVLFAAHIASKNIKGGGGLQAIGRFWFEGGTSVVPDDEIDVSYVLQMFGTFDPDDNWPGDNTLTMTDWNLKVETTSKGGRKIACTSDGPFPAANVMIDVLQTQ